MKGMKKSCRLITNKIQAFTLLECLVALLVIAGAIQVYQGLTQVLSSQVHYLSTNRQQEWLLFCQQMTRELENTKLVKVENQKLYVTKGNQELAFGLSTANDFRKTNADGRGYQPMLFHLEQANIWQEENRITVNLTFDNGLERSYVYAFEKEG